MIYCEVREADDARKHVCTLVLNERPTGFTWSYRDGAELDEIEAGATIELAKDNLRMRLPVGKYELSWINDGAKGKRGRGRPRKNVKMKYRSIPLPEELDKELEMEAGLRGMKVTAFIRNLCLEFMRPGSLPRLELYHKID